MKGGTDKEGFQELLICLKKYHGNSENTMKIIAMLGQLLEPTGMEKMKKVLFVLLGSLGKQS